ESVAFSPDGTRIVSGSGNNTLRIWDADSGTQIWQPLTGHNDQLTSVALSESMGLLSPRKPNPDGWLIHPIFHQPFIWVSPSMCLNFVYKGNPIIISKSGFTSLSFENCCFGNNWMSCFLSDTC